MPCGASGGGGVFRRAVVWCRRWCGRLPGLRPRTPCRPSGPRPHAPDGLEVTPGRLGTASDGQGAAPDGPGTAPDGQGAAPDGQGAAPDGPGTAPDGPGVEPDRLMTARNGRGEVPDGPGTAPGRLGTAPDRPGVEPDRPGVKPDRLIAAPDRPGTAPDRPKRPRTGRKRQGEEGQGGPRREVASPRLGGAGLYCRPTWSSSLPTLRPRSSSSARSLVVRSARDRGGASPDGTETMSPGRRWRGPWV